MAMHLFIFLFVYNVILKLDAGFIYNYFNILLKYQIYDVLCHKNVKYSFNIL